MSCFINARYVLPFALFSSALWLGGCGSSSDESPPPEPCSLEAQTGCEEGFVCESVQGGEPRCFEPVVIAGKVVSALDPDEPIAQAHVVARDPDGAAMGRVAITADDGSYSLPVPAPRDQDGKPLSQHYTLRADAASWDSFPSGLRVALPIDVREAAGSPLAVSNAATTIALYPLVGEFGAITGNVEAERPGGTLIVAGDSSAIADASGAYTIFNLPAGSYDVRGYAAGLQLVPAQASVEAGELTEEVNLLVSDAPLGRVGGTISIVDAPGGAKTSVLLAVEETFNEGLERGEVPRGLRAANVDGNFSIDGVPDGNYVVLAAFENDDLVRDPDTSIGNTATLRVTVKGEAVEAGNFKVTEALPVVSPGADRVEEVEGTPTFTFGDDSNEDRYVVEVFDNFGQHVWEDDNVPSVQGNKTVSVTYAGPALTPGSYYQFRATSMKKGVPQSRTEDLRGVFVAR